MKSSAKILLASILCISFCSCVTTREQLNDENANAQSQPSNAVKSEDIDVKPKPAAQPSQPSPLASNVPSQPAEKITPPSAPPPTANTSGQAAVPGPMVVAPSVVPKATPTDYTTYSEDELRAEVARLSGKVEDDQHDKQIADQQRADEDKKYQDRIAELEKKLKELQPDAVAVPEGKTPYEAGKEAYLAGKYDDAISFLTQVLAKSDTGKEAEEATYMRGESYFMKNQFNKAIVDFSHFPEKYQKSPYHPKALLGIAQSFEEMGRKDDAKAFYSDLVDKFPKTVEGKIAKKRLKGKK